MEVGDEGIWVTFVRGMKTKAVREFQELCEEVRHIDQPNHPQSLGRRDIDQTLHLYSTERACTTSSGLAQRKHP